MCDEVKCSEVKITDSVMEEPVIDTAAAVCPCVESPPPTIRKPINEKRVGDNTVKQIPVVQTISQHDEVASAGRVVHFMFTPAPAGVTISESIL